MKALGQPLALKPHAGPFQRCLAATLPEMPCGDASKGGSPSQRPRLTSGSWKDPLQRERAMLYVSRARQSSPRRWWRKRCLDFGTRNRRLDGATSKSTSAERLLQKCSFPETKTCVCLQRKGTSNTYTQQLASNSPLARPSKLHDLNTPSTSNNDKQQPTPTSRNQQYQSAASSSKQQQAAARSSSTATRSSTR